MRTLLLLTAAVIAVVAGIAAMQWSNKNGGSDSPAAPATATSNSPDVSAVDVLVARNDIAVGTMITEDMVDKQPWPDHLLLEGFITGDVASSGVIGKIARAPVLAREPIIMNKLADANQPGFLAATLGEGMRAMTLATDAVSGIAGYIFPGDRVDVLFVHNLAGQSAVPATSEIIAPNVRVLAINLRDPGVSGALTSVVTGSGGAPSTITVEVNEQMAQKLRLAEKVGSLSLTLRSIHDKGKEEGVPASHLSNLSSEYMTGGGGETVRIIRGTGEQNTPEAAVAPASGGAGLSGLIGGILR